jgi:hypothetical protein
VFFNSAGSFSRCFSAFPLKPASFIKKNAARFFRGPIAAQPGVTSHYKDG